MSWKDDLKNSQQQGITYPKLEIDYRINVKNKNGKAIFSFYDGEKVVDFTETIKGIYLGSAMHISCFDNSFGKNGGSYNSTSFLRKTNQIVLFDPSGSKVIKGIYDEIVNYLQKLELRPSLKRNIYIVTDKGLIDITTILAIDIELMKTYEEDTFIDNLMNISPKLFMKNDNDFSAKVNKILKIAANPPAYANYTKGDIITEEIATKLDIKRYVEMFNKWKEYIMNSTLETVNQEKVNEKVEEFTKEVEDKGLPVISNKDDEDYSNQIQENNDLPF